MTTPSGALFAPHAGLGGPLRIGPLRLTAGNASVRFAIRFLGAIQIRGTFERLDGELSYDDANPSAASLVARVEVASIATGNRLRDAHLRSAAWFDARRHAFVEMRSTRFARQDGGVRIAALVTMRGREAPVEIVGDALREGAVPVLLGRFSIARSPYGVGPRPPGVAPWDPRAYLVDVAVSVELRLRLDP